MTDEREPLIESVGAVSVEHLCDVLRLPVHRVRHLLETGAIDGFVDGEGRGHSVLEDQLPDDETWARFGLFPSGHYEPGHTVEDSDDEPDDPGPDWTMSWPDAEPCSGSSESGLGEDGYSPVWADDDRPRIPRIAGEREALAAYLDYYRATVEMKVRDLTPEQARSRPVAPSTMSAHGLVRHLAGVERWWFQQNFERRDVPFLFITTDEPNLDFDPPADADLAADLDTWRAECEVSREICASHALDETARPLDWHEDVDLRWLVLRMVAEYVQHCGHLDLIREAIDGRTGS